MIVRTVDHCFMRFIQNDSTNVLHRVDRQHCATLNANMMSRCLLFDCISKVNTVDRAKTLVVVIVVRISWGMIDNSYDGTISSWSGTTARPTTTITTHVPVHVRIELPVA